MYRKGGEQFCMAVCLNELLFCSVHLPKFRRTLLFVEIERIIFLRQYR